ncbi:MAG: hypothetical protein QM626_08415 [Microbacterium sp.]|uniref:hypothetical protein n=1 Tax=Microbacterium sp. TaxID=51671 RepID=UPI0039E53218
MSDTTASSTGGTTVLPPLPPRSAAEAAEAAYASDFHSAPTTHLTTPAEAAEPVTDVYHPVAVEAAAPAAPANATPKRRRGVIAAIIGGGVLAVALIFGGGMWAGWALGSSQTVSTTFEQGEFPGGDGSQFGPGSGTGEQGTVPTRPDDGSDSSGSDADS